jgi:tetratricopeptide (TPR) repeat protein
MIRTSAKAAWVVLLLSGMPGLASAAVPAPVPSASKVTLPQLVEQGRQALLADKYADSLELFKQVMARPDFQRAEPGLQFFALVLGAYAASGAEDYLTAHEYLLVATGFPNADGEEWIHRAGTARALEKWDDAALSLTTAARKWPESLKQDEYHGRLVMGVVREMGKQPALLAQRRELLDALFAANFKLAYDNEPSYLWFLLVADALERKDLARASAVARRISDSSTLVWLRNDTRFDALTAKDPKTFDVRAAAERDARRLKDAMKAHPKELRAVVQYAYALHTLGKFTEMLTLADEVIARIDKAPADQQPYEDLEEYLSWIHNHKATALRALGRFDEAARVLADWRRSGRNSDDKVSQAINLGFFYNELGRPAEALAAVEGLDWARGMSGYGRTQCQFVRFQAFTQLGKTAEAQEVVTWMRQNQSDSMQTAQGTLLESGDVDGAAALLIARLRDAEERPLALAEMQTYARTPRTDRQKKLEADREAFLKRPDVVAAIAEYGRRETFPVYTLEY